MKIKEVIVVEGRDDTAAIKRAVNADTIETGGSAINQKTIEKIRLAQSKRGVIIFTDPDYQGERIRKIISKAVPGCKHAFITQADGTKKDDIGVENASVETIIRALSDVRTEMAESAGEITADDMLAYRLTSGADSKERRIKLGESLGIGYANAKQMLSRLNAFQISREEFLKAIEALDQEEGKS
ncbi:MULTISPECIES: ribonuclease M5 [Brevibacillus]|jgi:ribonuclease M5|uniref:Ribonuclease M5 n=1 Tax=Brevibacillus borstelensis AK1 TaxID=1300222 RepID=M8D456_9BACL|nr:ribonuclease M5 [Brevibacillus borstelensis]EMT51044.1 5S ribosomal RNA maturase [Brevibacillus borstelensis AK1]KKX52762.1 DNA primase [Brevibacillus borstelensis cifa_chp40]MBE5395810.1 ribonuclease M5 [Brevibacillus borstelensis]MCC0567518.1 ribonuclease M5 [Brevibacillus borstelensis]MCM3472703.1 ribonuclease M5 [Brevibacillus borstelensis]